MIAVYPFTPHPAITKGIIEAADIPVFSGVGGGLTQGMRSAYMSYLQKHKRLLVSF